MENLETLSTIKVFILIAWDFTWGGEWFSGFVMVPSCQNLLIHPNSCYQFILASSSFNSKPSPIPPWIFFFWLQSEGGIIYGLWREPLSLARKGTLTFYVYLLYSFYSLKINNAQVTLQLNIKYKFCKSSFSE